MGTHPCHGRPTHPLLVPLQLAYAIDDERKLQGADINQLVSVADCMLQYRQSLF